MTAPHWDPNRLPDQSGRTVVVTGANAGLGFFTSAQLAAAGAHVVLACRNARRADAAAHAIRLRTPSARLDLIPLDTADLGSVREAAERIRSLDRVDVLVANAGIVHPPRHRQVSVDGNELVLATNLLGHFALVALTMPALERTAHEAVEARVVTLGSLASRLASLRLDDLQLERSYSGWQAYAQSKIAVQAFGFELDRRLRAGGSEVRIVVAHPGYSISGLTPRVPGVNEPTRGRRFAGVLQSAFAQGKDHGAWAPVRAATEVGLGGGEYVGPRLLTRGAPARATPTATSVDPAVGARLWQLAEQYTGVPFAL
ncbi:SDR family NAD(P)-dependent oxidoreductase [Microbacterium sp. STN6]|uniref:SDR family NAD(P)-dependent oxidoreductase n=1 Tax=Microbacterium sp. STN6 TaxID=2995588 RepID=UPI002260B837|nr:SDR family NAD(P)-dependent oxidoreductase [Microbacterium sp. STN6]MCX7522948.1 SDR family NAD(P)-dependent oxidoreductase [Microbacterium sp. STN6]